MPLAIAYWVIMLIWLVLGLYQSGIVWLTGPNIILFVLLLLLGWKVFGVPLQG
jgi:hypothetical protein